MLYCTFEQYQASGGTLDESAFAPLCAQASKLIDRYTFGRAEKHIATCNDCADSLALACVSIVDKLAQSKTMQAAAGYTPGISRVSNDGYDVTFSDGALAERIAAEAHGILICCLGYDPHGLLYRGCG